MRQEINLYSPDLRTKREWLTGKHLLIAMSILIVLLGLYGGTLRWEYHQLRSESDSIGAELGRRKEELARLNDEIAQHKVSDETQAALQRAEAALLDRERIREVLDNITLVFSEGFAEFLRAFARQTQDGLWMVGLRMAEGGRSITLTGRTLDPNRIPDYIRRLNGEPTLRGRSFEAMNLQQVAEADRLAGAGVAAPARGAGQGEAKQQTQPYHEFLLAAVSESGKIVANQGEWR